MIPEQVDVFIAIDVQRYKSKKEFLADKNKYLAPERYADHKYGFLIKDAIRFDKPIYMPGRLDFFNDEI